MGGGREEWDLVGDANNTVIERRKEGEARDIYMYI